jgi:hypothetical protein
MAFLAVLMAVFAIPVASLSWPLDFLGESEVFVSYFLKFFVFSLFFSFVFAWIIKRRG